MAKIMIAMIGTPPDSLEAALHDETLEVHKLRGTADNLSNAVTSDRVILWHASLPLDQSFFQGAVSSGARILFVSNGRYGVADWLKTMLDAQPSLKAKVFGIFRDRPEGVEDERSVWLNTIRFLASTDSEPSDPAVARFLGFEEDRDFQLLALKVAVEILFEELHGTSDTVEGGLSPAELLEPVIALQSALRMPIDQQVDALRSAATTRDENRMKAAALNLKNALGVGQ